MLVFLFSRETIIDSVKNYTYMDPKRAQKMVTQRKNKAKSSAPKTRKDQFTFIICNICDRQMKNAANLKTHTSAKHQ